MNQLFMTFLILATSLAAPSVFADDLRSLPTRTKLTSSVGYSVLANSICLVMTPSEFKHGFDPDECLGFFHQESVDTCILKYPPSQDERTLNGFFILRLLDVKSFMYPKYDSYSRSTPSYSPEGITAFSASNLSEGLGFQMACRSAGGKKQLDLGDLRRVLAPYFDLEIPRPSNF